MRLFFSNLQEYTNQHQEGKECPPFFNHLAQIQTRLQFLGVIFSIQVSPPDFHLTNAHIHILWECLASDPICSDDFFQWLLVQVHSKEQHAIALDGFRLIYNDKLPTLKPETISMLGLNLFSQLCQLSNISRHQMGSGADISGVGDSSDNSNSIKMDQLWRIALCAQNTDVSMKAIQILNSAYFSQGEEFLKTCMRSLKAASDDLWHAGVSQKIASNEKGLTSNTKF
jgi:ubiquitin carboxyl-terminal hydrolase 34